MGLSSAKMLSNLATGWRAAALAHLAIHSLECDTRMCLNSCRGSNTLVCQQGLYLISEKCSVWNLRMGIKIAFDIGAMACPLHNHFKHILAEIAKTKLFQNISY